MSVYPGYQSGFEEGIEQSMAGRDDKGLDFPFLLWIQLRTIITISSREFHQGIRLYNDGGSLRSYIPDVLESYCNAIINFSTLLKPYYDTTIEKAIEHELPEIIDKKEKHTRLYEECLRLTKRLGLLPDESQRMAVVFGEKISK